MLLQVTQAAFSVVGVGGGFSTTLLLTTGGLWSCSDLSGFMVINVFDLFLLSCLGRLWFTWKGLSMLLLQSLLGSGHHWALQEIWFKPEGC